LATTQHPPSYIRDHTQLKAAEWESLVSRGVLVGTVKHLENEELDQLVFNAISTVERIKIFTVW
jgi:hypothetical protein